MLLGVVPLLLDFLDVTADADAVDFPVGSEDANRDRNVVTAAGAVDDVLEQKRLALGFRNSTAELPAHQRVHLGILVDRPRNADQKAFLLESGDMRVQVRISEISHAFLQPSGAGLCVLVCGDTSHIIDARINL